MSLETLRQMLACPEPVTWVFAGDSITHASLHTRGWRGYVEHFSERVRWELRRTRDVVINTGISGETVPGLLADLEHRVLRFRPGVVSVMMGINDSVAGPEGRERFRADYERLLHRLREESEAVILVQTPQPVAEFGTRAVDLPAYAQIVRETAERAGVALVDQDRMWREYLQMPGRNLHYLLDDGTNHPNGYGHLLMARHLLEVLGIFDAQSPLGRLYVP